MSAEASRIELADSPAATEAIGARLARGLGPGDVVLVGGELGAGKTTLIRGACRALGVTDRVVSPTFTVGRRYRGRIPVSHLDLYRLEGLEGEDPGLLDDYLTPDAVAFVEWPGALADQLARDGIRVACTVELRHGGEDRRELRIEVPAEGPAGGAQ